MEKRFIKINTTAYSEEDFLLLTDLTDEQIEEVITPIVQRERNGGEPYDNDELYKALSVAYPNNEVSFYTEDFDIIYI
jgi:hypothetical protein